MKRTMSYVGGHELELRYVNYINILKTAQNKHSWTNFIWMWILKTRLRMRLVKLEESLNENCINRYAYNVWEQMIKEVL